MFTSGKAYTREEFAMLRESARKRVQRESTIAALVSILLGGAAILFLRWIDHSFTDRSIFIPLGTFGLFAAVVGWRVYRLQRARKTLAIRCPQCGEPLDEESERIVSALGKCDRCGGEVIRRDDSSGENGA